jgi:hypothetical protein
VTKEQERRAMQEQHNQESGVDEYKQNFNKNINNITNYFGKTMKSVWGGEKQGIDFKGKKQTMRIHKSLAQNIIFNTISNFLLHFINFKYSLEDSREVILYFCKKYELDQSRTHLLLSELQSAQNQSFLTLTDFEIKLLSKEKI